VPKISNTKDGIAYSVKYIASNEGLVLTEGKDKGDDGVTKPVIGYGFRFKEPEGRATMEKALGTIATASILNGNPPTITKAQADIVLSQYIKEGEVALKKLHPDWDNVPEAMKVAARDFMFNKGNGKYTKDTKFRELIDTGKFTPGVFNKTKARSASNKNLVISSIQP
jgi:GH24 family phage-related lysozyme (muramidase)